MYGKHFSSMYSGSMFGKPAIVFATWGYAIANMRPSRKDGECYVEINPTMLAATFSASAEQVHEALIVLESADPASRTKTDDGCRLVLLEPQRSDGPMQYRVVNGAHYRAMRDEEERRAYLRDAKRAERSRKRGVVNNVNNVNRGQPRSTQAEAEVEVEVEEAKEISPSLRKVGDLWNALAKEWGKRQIRDPRLLALSSAIGSCEEDLRREDSAFSWDELFSRIRQQAFLHDQFAGFDLGWLVATKRGERNALRVWSMAYADGKATPTAAKFPVIAPMGGR